MERPSTRLWIIRNPEMWLSDEQGNLHYCRGLIHYVLSIIWGIFTGLLGNLLPFLLQLVIFYYAHHFNLDWICWILLAWILIQIVMRIFYKIFQKLSVWLVETGYYRNHDKNNRGFQTAVNFYLNKNSGTSGIVHIEILFSQLALLAQGVMFTFLHGSYTGIESLQQWILLDAWYLLDTYTMGFVANVIGVPIKVKSDGVLPLIVVEILRISFSLGVAARLLREFTHFIGKTTRFEGTIPELKKFILHNYKPMENLLEIYDFGEIPEDAWYKNDFITYKEIEADCEAIRNNLFTTISKQQRIFPSTISPEKTTYRNSKCPCGSGKRYKHCCGEIR